MQGTPLHNKIDYLVYSLYVLTEGEIGIVEGGKINLVISS